MIIKHKLKMEMTGMALPQRIEVMQHEQMSRILELSLQQNGIPMEVSPNCKVVIQYRKPDGQMCSYDTLDGGEDAWYISGNTIGATLLPDVCDTAGITILKFKIVEEEQILFTFPVEVSVKENFVTGIKKSGGYLSGFLPQPQDAKLGEFLSIAEIDGQGRVVLTKSVPMEATVGPEGASAYEIAVRQGFMGTEKEWLKSLVGPQGPTGPAGSEGKTAYAYARDGGYPGTEAEFAEKLASEAVTVPSDWNAAEGEPGHVQNRTHYEDGTEIKTLLEITVTAASNQFQNVGNVPLEEGKAYTVTWDGTAYACVAFISDVLGFPAPYLGNPYFIGGENNGVPFGFVSATRYGQYGGMAMVDGSHTIKITEEAKVYKPLNECYLPPSSRTYIIILQRNLDTDMSIGRIEMSRICYDEFAEILWNGGNVLLDTSQLTFNYHRSLGRAVYWEFQTDTNHLAVTFVSSTYLLNESDDRTKAEVDFMQIVFTNGTWRPPAL